MTDRPASDTPTPLPFDPLALRDDLYRLYRAYMADEQRSLLSVPGTPQDLEASLRSLCRPDSEEEFERHLAAMPADELEAYVAELRRGYPAGGATAGGPAEQSSRMSKGEVPLEWQKRLGPGPGLDRLSEWLSRRSGPSGGRVA